MSPAPGERGDRPPVPAGAEAHATPAPPPPPLDRPPAPPAPTLDQVEREVESLTVPRRSLFEAQSCATPEALLGVRRANPLSVAVSAVRGAWGLIALVAFGLAGDILAGDLRALGILAAASALILVACAVLSWVVWRTRTWELADEGIVLCHGVLNKKRLQVPYEHVHTIQMGSGLLERLFGLIKLDFDTGAAVAEGEATAIEGLRAGEAQALREEIFRRKRLAVARATDVADANDADAGPGAEHEERPEERPVATYRLRGRELLLAAASQTSAVTQAAALLVLLANGANQLIEWGVLDIVDTGDELMRVPLTTLVPVVTVTIVLALLIGGVASFAINLVRYGGYRAERFADRVTIEHGLISRSSRTLALERVQFVLITQGLLRQLLGYAEVRAQVVASPGENEGEPSGAVLLHPFLRASEVGAFLSEVLPSYAGVLDAVELGRLEGVARRRAVVRAIAWLPLLAALVAAAAWLLTAGPLEEAEWLLRPMLVAASIASALTLVVLVVDALRGWSAARYGHTLRELVLVSGGLTRLTAIAPRSHLQRMELSRSPFQQRAKVATLSVRTASINADGLRLRDVPDAAAEELLAWFRPRG